MALNPNDDKRDKILRFLYERHKHSRGIAKIPIGIRDLQSEMKKRYLLPQQEVSSNLDYLVQVGWVREVIRERSITTKTGMELSQEQIKYKISDIGINHLEAGTLFKNISNSNINITNIQGVTIIGDGNVVNNEYTDLFRLLDVIEKEIGTSEKLNDVQKLDAAGDTSTIKTQIAKKNPNKTIIATAWSSLKVLATLAGATDAALKIEEIIKALF
jgi:hypothetical protein